MTEILGFCERQLDWTLETIRALVELESPTADKAAVDQCGAELAGRLRALGGRVTLLPRAEAGDHLLAEFGCGATQILLLGHFDTVWPVGTLDTMPLTELDGRLYGPGVFDMKAGIVLAMLAVRALHELGQLPGHRIVMLWTADEETGSASSRSAVEEEAARSEAVLVLEPPLPGGALKTSRKGCGVFRLAVRGRAAHAGIDPGQGASAVTELCRQILTLEALSDPAAGVTLNVGTVAGGSRPNVVPETATATIDVRVPTAAQGDRIAAAFRALVPHDARTTLSIEGGIDRPPLERTAAVIRLFEQARGVAGALGRNLEEGATGGGSDGNITAAVGVPTLDGLGAVGDGAHARHEHVQVRELAWRAALVAGLLVRLGPPSPKK